jgi:hypothetical protein
LTARGGKPDLQAEAELRRKIARLERENARLGRRNAQLDRDLAEAIEEPCAQPPTRSFSSGRAMS